MFIRGNGYLPYCDSRNNLLYSMKTILEWLNEAKEQGYEWADAAIRNYDPKFTTRKERESLKEALYGAFNWWESPEKKEFWHGVSESLRATVSGDSTFIEYLIEDLEKLNNALGNLAYNDALKEPYRTQIYEATKASYEDQFAEIKTEIAKKLGIEPPKERKLIGWVMQNEDGGYGKCMTPVFTKEGGQWLKDFWLIGWWSDITPEQAAALCCRLPQWSDDEPTPIYQ